MMFEIKNKKKLYSDKWHVFGNRSSDQINHSKNTNKSEYWGFQRI